MFKELQDVVAVFVHLALASTFSLNIAILSAGLVNARSPLGCKACVEGLAAAPAPKLKTVAIVMSRPL
jgi:hypothetical protein